MNIVLLITSLLPVAASAIPGLSSTVKQIITDIAQSLGAMAASGVLQAQNVSTVLAALAGVIAALKAEPNIPPDVLNLISALERAAAAALAADQAAQQKVDPGTLQPIAPVA